MLTSEQRKEADSALRRELTAAEVERFNTPPEPYPCPPHDMMYVSPRQEIAREDLRDALRREAAKLGGVEVAL